MPASCRVGPARAFLAESGACAFLCVRACLLRAALVVGARALGLWCPPPPVGESLGCAADGLPCRWLAPVGAIAAVQAHLLLAGLPQCCARVVAGVCIIV